MTIQEKEPWLCRQYNNQGWAFRYPILTTIFFHLHERVCPDNATDVMTEEEFLAYLDSLQTKKKKK